PLPPALLVAAKEHGGDPRVSCRLGDRPSDDLRASSLGLGVALRGGGAGGDGDGENGGGHEVETHQSSAWQEDRTPQAVHVGYWPHDLDSQKRGRRGGPYVWRTRRVGNRRPEGERSLELVTAGERRDGASKAMLSKHADRLPHTGVCRGDVGVSVL